MIVYHIHAAGMGAVEAEDNAQVARDADRPVSGKIFPAI